MVTILRRWPISLLALVQSSFRAGVPHLLLSVVAVQGLTFLTQLFIARRVGPSGFGIVRSVESILTVALIVASFGMPILAVKCMQELTDDVARGRLLGKLMTLAFAVAAATAVSIGLMLPYFVRSDVSSYLGALAFVLVLSACSRTAINYFQGVKLVARVSLLTVAVASVSFLIIVAAVWTFGLDGWVMGRYAGELLLLTFALVYTRRVISFTGVLPAQYSSRALLLLSAPITLSLLARSGLDNLGMIWMTHQGIPTRELGIYGLATLLAMPVLLIPATVSSTALPRFVERARGGADLRAFFLWTIKVVGLATVAASLLAIALVPVVIVLFFGEYASAVPVAQVLLLAVPLRAVTVISCTLLLAVNKNKRVLVVYVVEAFIAVSLLAYLVPRSGVLGAAQTAVFTEFIISALLFYMATVAIARIPTVQPEGAVSETDRLKS